MPYQLGAAPPGLRGFLMSRQNQMADQQAQMQAVQQAMGLQGLLMKQQMAPLEMELMRAKVEEAKSAPQRAQVEALLRQAQLEKAQREAQQAEVASQARMGLAGLLSGNFAPGNTGVMTDINAARQAAAEAAARGEQFKIAVPNPANVQALSILADPTGRLMKNMQPPKPTGESTIGKLIRERDSLPPGDPRRGFYDQAIEKQSTHSPAVNVYSGSLTPGVDASGKPVFVQPSGRPDTPPRVVENVFPTPKPATQRAIPTPLANKLTEAAELADATTRFATTFKDSYGGKTLTGDLSNTTGKLFGDDTGQAQWWQDYELHQSQIRNKLFGSALTAPEIEAWNKSAINPRMNPKQIKANLERRNKLETTGLNRLMKGAAAGGYSKEQIEAFTGRPVDTTTRGGATVSNW